jgi:hypothetical protein
LTLLGYKSAEKSAINCVISETLRFCYRKWDEIYPINDKLLHLSNTAKILAGSSGLIDINKLSRHAELVTVSIYTKHQL